VRRKRLSNRQQGRVCFRRFRQKGVTMSENKKGFHKTLSSIVEARGREAGRQVSYRMQHQLIGSFTKRP
jgi:hypothetical protein